MTLFTAGQKIRASQLNVGLGTYSRYSGTSTAIPLTTWTPVPFATLSQGSGSGLTVATPFTSFTLAAGCWHVEFGCNIDASTHAVTGGFLALANTSGVPAASAYAQIGVPTEASQMAGTISADIVSDGTFVVIPHAYVVGAASVISLANGLAPRLTFKQVND